MASGGHERRGQLQARSLGQVGRRQRIPDRAQILELMLGRLEALTQRRELLVADLAFSAQARDQRLLAVFALTQVADLTLSGIRFGVQPPKLCVLLIGLPAHDLTARSEHPMRAYAIVSHRVPDCPCLPAVPVDCSKSKRQRPPPRWAQPINGVRDH